MNEFLHMIQIVNTGTPSILLVGIIIYLIRYKDRLDVIGNSIDEVKDNLNEMHSLIVWKDVYEPMHREIERRVEVLEKKAG